MICYPKYSRDIAKEKANVEKSELLKRINKNGEFSLKSMLGFFNLLHAEHAKAVLFEYILKQKISTHFTDVSSDDNFLDVQDWSTAESMRDCYDDTDASIDIQEPAGLHVRNHHMASLALAHTRAHGARIAIQQCGNAHVIGKGEIYPARQSLSAHFKAMGAAVIAMPVLNARFDANALPSDHGLKKTELHFIEGLPEIDAFYRDDRPVENFRADLECRADEAAYINSLLWRMGLGDAYLSAQQQQNLRQGYAEAIPRLL